MCVQKSDDHYVHLQSPFFLSIRQPESHKWEIDPYTWYNLPLLVHPTGTSFAHMWDRALRTCKTQLHY